MDGKQFYRADCMGPVSVAAEGCEPDSRTFQHFSLSDGMAYADRAVFAQLTPSDKWYVTHGRRECPALVVQPLNPTSKS